MTAQTADVVVIGAGVVGASTALELQRSGYDVLVVDRAGGPGFGSTSASMAIVRFIYSTVDGVAAAWESKFRWESWAEHLGFVDPGGMARLVRTGIVFLDVDQFPRARVRPLLDEVGVPYEEWTPEELARRVPGVDPGVHHPPKPVTSDEFYADASGRLGAVFTPDGGYVDDPQLATLNLAHAAQSRGARFEFRRTVTGIARTTVGWRVELGAHGSVEAPVVVNCGGPWSSGINRLAGVGADFGVSVRPLRQEVHQVPLPASLAGSGGAFAPLTDLDLGTYLRPDGSHSLLVGGTEPVCDPLEWLDDPDDNDPRPTRERFEAQTLRAARRFPELPVPNTPRGISGVYDVSSDWMPIYDRTDAPGYYVAMGTSGNQFKNAPVIGGFMATLVTAVEGGHDHDRHPVTFDADHIGRRIDLGTFSRTRQPHPESTGTVIG